MEEWKKHYDSYYEGPSEWRDVGAVDKANNITKLCHSVEHGTVLEIGAGEGAILQKLAELEFGKELYGIEISKSGVVAMRQRTIPTLVAADVFDGQTVPFDDERFDLVILSHVVEHLEDPRRIVCEAMRVGKSVFVEVPLEDNLRLGRDYVPSALGHINLYNQKTIRHFLQSCGLRILSQIVVNGSYSSYRYRLGPNAWTRYVPKEVLIRIAPRLAPSLWTYHSALLGQRVVLAHGE